ncbi:MAG TPA: ribosome-associated translation inhibitor RaiA [Chthoniobacteraceae bacterium]|jgi:putative sigma-54 modulation protein|nr:ribosome-associated translation inhibitor RaiA [Chthoniobacteraceae bacterium]
MTADSLRRSTTAVFGAVAALSYGFAIQNRWVDRSVVMQIHLSPRHLRLTAAIHQQAAEKVLQLETLAEDIIGAHVVLVHDDTAKPASRYTVKVHLAIPGPDIHAEESASDLYAAMDLVVDKLSRQLRRRKTRLVDQRHGKIKKAVRAPKASVA